MPFTEKEYNLKMDTELKRMSQDNMGKPLNEPLHGEDEYDDDDDDTWDYVIMFKVPQEKENASETDRKNNEMMNSDRRAVLRRIENSGLHISPSSLSPDGKRVIYKIRADEETIERTAEEIGMSKELSREARTLVALDMGLKLDGSTESIIPNYTEYFRFKRDDFVTQEVLDNGTLFDKSERQRLIYTLLSRKVNKGGAGLDCSSKTVYRSWNDEDPKLKHRKLFLDVFPLHNEPVRRELMREWVFGWVNINPFKWMQPIDKIRDYFGEQVALYFSFLGFYTTWLWAPAIVGLIVFVIGVGLKSNDYVGTIVYAVFLAIWATIFLEFWKRQQSFLAFQWDMLDYEEEEEPRPQYTGRDRISPITGTDEIYYPEWKRILKTLFATIPILLFMLAIVLGATYGIILLRNLDGGKWKVGAGILNSFLIIITNKIFKKIAWILNDFENHRTPTDWEDSYIVKSFAFQFCNSYSSLCWLAYKERSMNALSAQLASMFISMIIVGQTLEFIKPFIKWFIGGLIKGTLCKASSKGDDAATKGAMREAGWPGYENVRDDFNEMAVQFGYVTLFAAAFPLAALAALLNNLIEIRTDAYKILSAKKPHYLGGEDIGSWFAVFEFMALACTVTNCLIILFTSDQLPEKFGVKDWKWRMLIVVGIEHFLICGKILMTRLIPDQVDAVRMGIARDEYKEKLAMEKMEELKLEMEKRAHEQRRTSINQARSNSNV